MLNKFYIKFILFIVIVFLITIIIDKNKTSELPIIYDNDINYQKTYDNEDEYLIYVADKNNILFPLNIIACSDDNFNINYYQSKIKNELDKSIYMTFSLLTNYSNHLPQETFTFIPKTTKLLSYNINEGVLELNLSNDFFQYNPKYESEILKILTYTFTSITGVNEIKISKLEKHQTTFSRDDFILNMFIEDKVSNDLEKFNIYYITEVDKKLYLVKTTIFDSSSTCKVVKINNLLTNVENIPLKTLITKDDIIKNAFSEQNLTFYQYYLTYFDNNIKDLNINIDIKNINFHITIFN